jgi:prepilin-type N-terminal cleavage/methylation domain-containing protein
MTRLARGFTMIELAIVLTITAVIIPGIYLWWRAAERGLFEAVAQIESADAARTVSEELRRDLLLLSWKDAETLALQGKACAEVRYEIEQSVLHRRAGAKCGGDRALARRVESLTRTPWGVELTFARNVGANEPYRVRVLVAGGETR